jgi:hypothetical protein
MSHTNAQVAAAFIRQEHAQSGSMKSDGAVLWSYATPIARHAEDGTIVVSSQVHSVTTSRHHSELWSAAYAAGYDGPAAWQGRDSAKKSDRADTIPFHDAHFPAERYGRRGSAASPDYYPARSYGYDSPGNVSNHDARAVVWRWSADAYEARAKNREWYEILTHATVTRKETATR